MREKSTGTRLTKRAAMLAVLQAACQAIVDKKGQNVVTLDVRGVSTMTDYFIIAEGTVPRHVKAIAQYVDEVLHQSSLSPVHVEGMQEGEWIVLDYMDVILHFFTPDFRHHYALEEVWKEGKVMTIPVEYGRSLPSTGSDVDPYAAQRD
jgi:ribosome-associated protein